MSYFMLITNKIFFTNSRQLSKNLRNFYLTYFWKIRKIIEIFEIFLFLKNQEKSHCVNKIFQIFDSFTFEKSSKSSIYLLTFKKSEKIFVIIDIIFTFEKSSRSSMCLVHFWKNYRYIFTCKKSGGKKWFCKQY